MRRIQPAAAPAASPRAPEAMARTTARTRRRRKPPGLVTSMALRSHFEMEASRRRISATLSKGTASHFPSITGARRSSRLSKPTTRESSMAAARKGSPGQTERKAIWSTTPEAARPKVQARRFR